MNDRQTKDLRSLASAVIRRWPVVLAFALLGSLAGFAYGSQLAPTYRASATLVVGEVIAGPSAGVDTLATYERLTATYVGLAERQPVLQPVAESVARDDTWVDLRDSVRAEPIEDTSLFTVSATARTEERAESLADAVAAELERIGTPEVDSRRSFLDERLQRLQTEIEEAEAAVLFLADEAEATTDPDRSDELQRRLEAGQASIAALYDSYAALLPAVDGAPAAAGVEIFEHASGAAVRIGPNVTILTALGAVLGMLFATAFVLVVDPLVSVLPPTSRASGATGDALDIAG